MSEQGLYSVFDMLLKGDENSWIQMLVFAVLIGASAVSSIVRSRKQKRDLQEVEEEEIPARRLSPKQPRPQEPSRALQQRPESRPISPQQRQPARRDEPGRAQPRTIIRPGGALSAFVAQIKAEIKRAGDQMQGIKPPPQDPVHAPKPKAPAKAVPTPPVENDRNQYVVREEPEPDDLTDILPEFSSQDDLKRAILYLEILGKPVSMREPAGNLIGL